MADFNSKFGIWFIGFNHKFTNDTEYTEKLCNAITQIQDDEPIFTADKRFMQELLTDVIKLKEICANNRKDFGKMVFVKTDDDSILKEG